MRATCLVFAVGLTFVGGSLPEGPSAPRYKLVLQAPPAMAVNAVAVSPDGALVVTAAADGGVRLLDSRTGALVRGIGEAGDRGVVFAPDGKTLTAAGFHMDKLVSLWDVASGKRLRTFAGQTEWEADATALSPDGRWLASTGTDRQILVWNVATAELRLRLQDQPTRVAALAFSPDSQILAATGGDRCVRLWDCATGRLRRTLAGHGDWVCTVAFSPDGTLLASGSCDWGFHRGHDWPRPVTRGLEQCEWRLWDVATGELRRTVAGPGRLLSLAFAPDGRSLACGIGREVRLYAPAGDGPARVVTRHDADVAAVAFTPDGAAVVSGSHDQTTRRTNVATGHVDWQAPGYFEQVNSVALSDDGTVLVTGTCDQRFARGRLPAGAPHLGSGALRLWDAHTGRLLRRLGDTTVQVMAVALSPDGRRVAGGGIRSGKGVVNVWDTATGKPLWSDNAHTKEVLAAAFAPNGAVLAAGSADGVVTIYDGHSGSALRTLPGHEGGATAVLFSPDGKALFGAEAFGGVRVWDIATGRLLHTYPAAGTRARFFTDDRLMHSIGLSKDGGTLATCASSVNDEYADPVRLWDARTGTLRRTFAAEKIHGRPMALSPDGAVIATGGKSVKLWDARTGKLRRELTGHLKRTQSTVFSADGRVLVSGGNYGTTNVWEVATGRHLVTLFAFASPAADDWLAYHPDGYNDGSPGVDRYLAWRVGNDLLTPQTLGPEFHRPDRIAAALRLEVSRASPE